MNEVTYDIECLHSVFTITFMRKEQIVLVFFGNHDYDHISDEELLQPVRDYVKQNQLQFSKANMDKDPEIVLMRMTEGDTRSQMELKEVTSNVKIGMPLTPFRKYDLEHNENGQVSQVCYCGWNSYRYDLTLLNMMDTVLIDGLGTSFKPSFIKSLSDCIINFEGQDWQFANDVKQMLDESPKSKGYYWVRYWDPNRFKHNFNISMWSEKHIDWARLGKIAEEGQENKYPPSLKKEMARYGFNIVMDEQVSMDGTETLSDKQIYDLIYYNVNDVCGTRLIAQNQLIQSGLITRDIIRKLYPYTSPKNTPYNKLDKWSPSERDATAARLSGEVLIGENRKKPKDYETVSYYFPLANGQYVDLLEYMHENEKFMHPYMYEFFKHFRGKNTSLLWDDLRVKKAQPITHSATINIPYYRDGKPLDVYITSSTGGSHGSVMSGLSKLSPDEIDSWIKANLGAVGKEKVTLDVKNVVHIDWSSFYPVLASKLKLYIGSDGVDRYSGIIEHRLKLKARIPHDKTTWTEQNVVDNENQMGLKFILNNATGAGNMHQKYALLPLDNKTLSMRLIGNMHIWCLAQRLSQAGGFVFSTNTDGVYLVGLTIEEAQQVVDDYVAEYGMGVDPEFIPRMINRDTSNRIEYIDNETINTCGGRLRHGRNLYYMDESIGRNIPYPLAVGNAVLRYMSEDDQWLKKPFDRDKMKNYLLSIMQENDSITPWYHIYVSSSKRALIYDGQLQQRINRIILTNVGHKLESSNLRRPSKAHVRKIINWYIDRQEELSDIEKEFGFKAEFDENTEIKLVYQMNDNKMKAIKKQLDKSQSNADKFSELELQYLEEVELTHSFTEEEFNEYWKEHPKIKLLDGNNEEIKCWYISKLTGYPDSEGLLINTAEDVNDLKAIDANLNIEAYTDWCESLISTWKVTGEIPELGLQSYDDNLGFTAVTVSNQKTNKKSDDELIKFVYENIKSLLED